MDCTPCHTTVHLLKNCHVNYLMHNINQLCALYVVNYTLPGRLSLLPSTVKWVPAQGRWCYVVGKVKSNGSLLPGRWLKSPAGWLPVHRDQLSAQCSVTSMGSLHYIYYTLNIHIAQNYRTSEMKQNTVCTCQKCYNLLNISEYSNLVLLRWQEFATRSLAVFLTCHGGASHGGGGEYRLTVGVKGLGLLTGNRWMSQLRDQIIPADLNVLIAHGTRR